MTPQKVLVIAGYAASLLNFRGALLAEMRARGHAVTVLAPGLSGEEAIVGKLRDMGIESQDLELSRTGLNPLHDLQTYRTLRKVMREVQPNVVLAYTIKPVIWGLLAAAKEGVQRRVGLITGLGYAFTGKASGKRRVVQAIARALYRSALAKASLVFFQNEDDRQVFRDLQLLAPSTPTEVINGSGVDIFAFGVQPLPQGPIRFLMIARLLGDKGVREFAAAAEMVRSNHPEAQFDLVGGCDSNPDAIPLSEVESWQKAGHVIWHGEQRDVRPFIAQAHVYVLPSYREGTPRTVLEAMSMGRPIITTDAPGCRDTTAAGVNGLLVPVADASALAAAMTAFIQAPEIVQTMGHASRQRAEEKYDVRKVNAAMLKGMGL